MLNLGNLKWDMNDLDGAQQWFQRAIAANPDFAEAYNNLGALFRSNGHLEAARAILQTGLQKKQEAVTRASLMKNRGLVAYELGEPDSALYYLETVRDVFPDDPDVQSALNDLSH
jgi:tetratricopeptide (TPR) repeat protein